MKVCTTAYAVTRQDNYFSVATNCVEIRILFLTDSILRIRAGFDGGFEEESYSLVMTAWEDRMDGFLKNYRKRITAAKATLEDGEEKAVIQGRELTVIVEKSPFRICVYDKEAPCFTPILWIWLTRRIPTTAASTPVRFLPRIVSTVLAKKAENLTRPRNLWG